MTKINAIGAISMSAICVALAAGTVAAKPTTLTGTYVEARTAEVFAGGCIINSEAGTTGREALLAWNVEHGRFDGVRLDGLSVVAAVSADASSASTRSAARLRTRAPRCSPTPVPPPRNARR